MIRTHCSMGYLNGMWWHECTQAHGSLWLHNHAKECCHCGCPQSEGISYDAMGSRDNGSEDGDV